MNMMKYIKKAMPALALGIGFMLGKSYVAYHASPIEERPAAFDGSDSHVSKAIGRTSLEGNANPAKIVEVLQSKQSNLEKRISEYETRISGYETENSSLKEELTKLRHDAGIYDFSQLKEPSEVTLEERFAKSPTYYLGNIDKKYEDILQMIDTALKSQRNIRKGFFANNKDSPSAWMDFYNFGSMTVIKTANRLEYYVDIDLKEELLTEKAFKIGPDDYGVDEIRVVINKDKIDKENGIEELLNMYIMSQVHNVQLDYDITNMILSEHVSIGKIELPILKKEGEKVKAVPNSVVLAESIMQDIDFIIKDIK